MDSALEQCTAFGGEASGYKISHRRSDYTHTRAHTNMNNQVDLFLLPCLSFLVFDSSDSSVQLCQSLLISLFLIASVNCEVPPVSHSHHKTWAVTPRSGKQAGLGVLRVHTGASTRLSETPSLVFFSVSLPICRATYGTISPCIPIFMRCILKT